jgi:hypothetical protein
MCPTCELMRDFLSSPDRYAPSAAVLVNLSSAVDRLCRTLDVEQRQPWKECRWWARLNM